MIINANKQKKIIPAVLETKLTDLYKNIKRILSITNYLHIDYVDETFNNKFEYNLNDIDLSTIKNANFEYELHFLSNNFTELIDFLNSSISKQPKRVYIHLSELSKLTLDEQRSIITNISNSVDLWVAINPDECINDLYNFRRNFIDVDSYLLMTVTPGKQNSTFLNNQYLPAMLNLGLNVNVDGGINITTIDKIDQRIQQYIVGSYIIKGVDIYKNFNKLQNKIDNL